MKRILMVGVILAFAAGWLAIAQTTPTAPPGKTLAATMNIYVFPTKGQTPEVQSKDEADCYTWAVTQSGTDPFQLSKQAEAQKQQAANAQKQAAQTGQGAGASGAVKGAAAGALIGEIASDDAGKGAAYGAAAGIIAGRRKGKQAQAQAQDQAAQQSANQQAATQEQMNNFKKAFSVCLEAKNYMVK